MPFKRYNPFLMSVCNKRSADRTLEDGTYGDNHTDAPATSSSREDRRQNWWPWNKGDMDTISGAPRLKGENGSSSSSGRGETIKPGQHRENTGWKWKGWWTETYGVGVYLRSKWQATPVM